METSTSPFISCIVTAYSEGLIASVTLDSLLAQSFADFELLVVDDGATEETRQVLHSYDDPRVRHIRQSNDGQSSARNRALTTARGEYICFLDADDTRPIWAFDEMARVARVTDADVVFLPGLLSELRNEILPFYDDAIFHKLRSLGLAAGSAGTPDFTRAQSLLALIEPQSANKMIRRRFLETHQLRFPAGLFFEDLVFHNALILGLDSYALADLPCFTYFRRYGQPQATSITGVRQFDAISSAANALTLFEHSAHFQNAALRMSVLAATFKMLRWCEESISHHLRWQYRQALMAMATRLDPRYHHMPTGPLRNELSATASWASSALGYAEQLFKEARL